MASPPPAVLSGFIKTGTSFQNEIYNFLLSSNYIKYQNFRWICFLLVCARLEKVCQDAATASINHGQEGTIFEHIFCAHRFADKLKTLNPVFIDGKFEGWRKPSFCQVNNYIISKFKTYKMARVIHYKRKNKKQNEKKQVWNENKKLQMTRNSNFRNYFSKTFLQSIFEFWCCQMLLQN